MARRVPPVLLALLLGIAAGGGPLAYVVLTYSQLPGASPPTVALGNATDDSGQTRVVVLLSEPPRPLREFSATLTVDTAAFGTLSRLDRPDSGLLVFFDRDGDGQLTSGDRFSLLASFNTSWDGHYELRVNWRDTQVASTAWDVVRPDVTLGAPLIQHPMVTVDVVSATPLAPLADFSADLSGSGSPIWIPLSAPAGPPFEFADRDNDSRLSAGDRFTSWLDDPRTYTLRVLWRGTEVARRTWTIVPPNVTVAVSVVGPSTSWVNVTVSAPPHSCGEYEAWIDVNGLWNDYIPGLCNATGTNGILSAQDRDGDGNFTVGDRLVVEAGPSVALDLYVSWKGYTVLHESWTV